METYVSSLCRQLAGRGHRSDVATLDYLFKTMTPLPAYECLDGTDVIRLPSMGNARYFFAPRLLELVPRYDLIHIHGVDFFVDMLGTCKWMHGRPVVLSTHGGFFHTPWFPALKKAYFQTFTRMALTGVDRIIASSPKDQELFSQISGRVTLVENGIDYETFAGVVKRMGGASAEGTGAAPGGENLVFIGRISKNKRVDRLLEMLAVLRQQRPDATLTVVGPDWEGLQAGLEAQADGLGLGEAARFTGVLPQEDMLDILAGASLFVSASEYEAFGLSTVEAMASGTVPVVSRIPAFEDLVADGETGFLVDFSDPVGAAASVAQALAMPEAQLQKMGADAKAAASRHDWSQVADQIIDIYEEVIASRDAC
ncbi:MAG: glycosyltransferase family 4 protein [Actinobacteria bacterium]|nr:glycosyltransferase family 4 protein [Actinomycetota bacterium]